tara:strand:+ start:1861 stop:3606 length:1746 start_codon:yes stop_codon:yes gene_type:complete
MYKIIKKLFELLSFDKKNKFKVIYFLFLLLISTVLETLSITIIFPALKYISDGDFRSNILLNENFSFLKEISVTEAILLLLTVMIFIYLIKSIFLIYFSWWRINFVQKLQKDFTLYMYDHTLSLKFIDFSEKNTAVFTNEVIEESKKIKQSIDSCLKLLNELIVVSCIAFILLFYQTKETLVSLAFFSFIGFILYLSVKTRLRNLGAMSISAAEKVYQDIKEGFGGFKEIKIREIKDFFLDRFNLNMKKLMGAQKLQVFIGETLKISIEFIAVLFICLLCLVLIKFSGVSPQGLIPALALFGIAAYRFVPGINKILNFSSVLQTYSKTIDNFSNRIEFLRNKIDNEKILKTLEFKDEINLKNISFSYKDSRRNILKGLNFKIKKNDFICLYGSSGLGKSTLINIISGLLKETSGEFILDGKKINVEQINWRKNISLVPQNIFLLDDSIRTNIVLNEKVFDKNKLNQVIKNTNLENLIKSKKEGYDYHVGDNGSNLSGGQIQRIGIARALYNNPKILICDEISSSLDEKNEKEIVDLLLSLKDKGVTTIFITHRPQIFLGKKIRLLKMIESDKKITDLVQQN